MALTYSLTARHEKKIGDMALGRHCLRAKRNEIAGAMVPPHIDFVFFPSPPILQLLGRRRQCQYVLPIPVQYLVVIAEARPGPSFLYEAAYDDKLS